MTPRIKTKCDPDHPPEECEKWLGSEIFCARQEPSKRQGCLSNRTAPIFIEKKQRTCQFNPAHTAEDCVGTINWCSRVTEKVPSLSKDECLSRRPGAKEAIEARQKARDDEEAKEREAARQPPLDAASGPGVQLCHATFATEPVVELRKRDNMHKVEILGGKKIGPCEYVPLVLDKCIAVSSETGGFYYAVNINAPGWACNAYRDASCRWDFEANGNVAFEGLAR
ncbi:hypothetical protein CDD80_2475 [Ophiocordyceps camponoti-rufipedis]|uniref:Uncharacterized protein n=1 Tax=Ophiocordyceps camponoti-rufipedis TaxID=2004952 RepID=A0A2C5XK99_9HYPO|nr:hypothetical protein CDD80_2475 [Ophiocordyceps camponoti-rufipedis]